MTKNELRYAAAKSEVKMSQNATEMLIDLVKSIDDNDRKISVIIDALTVAYAAGFKAKLDTIPVVDSDDEILIL